MTPEEIKQIVDELKVELKKDIGSLITVSETKQREGSSPSSVILKELKEETDKKINYVLTIAVGIIIIFFLAGLPIFFDYFTYSEQKYEKFIDKTEEIKNNFYTKEEINSIFKNFKDCIWYNGLSNCLK